MGPVIEVMDAANERLADYVGLTDVQRRTSYEPEAGIFVSEGELVIRRALRAGYPLRSVLLAASFLPSLSPALASESAPVYVATGEVIESVAGFHVHRGALASFGRLPLPSPAELLARCRRVAVLEDVTNPTNLGAIVRSAAGLGMDGVLLSPTCADPLYRRSVRVSMGEVFAVPYARALDWPDALSDVRASHRLLALTPDPSAVPLDALDLSGSLQVALLLGAEGPGLSAGALEAADERVRIPMHGGVDSLNVAAAAAVAFYAVVHG